MREREKGDVIIDVCPSCHGVWLDPGELEKLSERERRYYDDDDDDDWDDDRRSYGSNDRPSRVQDSRTDTRARPQQRRRVFCLRCSSRSARAAGTTKLRLEVGAA
jgi:Zn-finger nucleic acid-binding protein